HLSWRSRVVRRGDRRHEAVRIGTFDMQEARHARLEPRPVGWQTRRRHRGERRAVITPVAADDLRLVELADGLPKEPRRLERGFVRFRAAAGEEESIDAWIENRGELLGEFRGGTIR